MDFSNHMGLIRALVPKIPLILSTAVAHTLSLSPTSHDWDLRTELIIRVLHSFLDPAHPAPLSKTQRLSTRDPGVKGPLWVSRVEFAPPPDQTDGESVRASVQKAFRALGNGDECWADENVAPTSVQAEWTGHRSGVHPGEPEIDGSEADKYRALMAEVESDVTILYFHGGGYLYVDTLLSCMCGHLILYAACWTQPRIVQSPPSWHASPTAAVCRCDTDSHPRTPFPPP